MKHRFLSLTFTLFFTALIISCNSNNSKEKKSIPMQHEMHAEDTSTDDKVQNSEELAFNDKEIEAIFQNYIDVKAALVKSDTGAAQEAANKLSESLNENREAIEYADKIAGSSDIEEQRKAFSKLTEPLESLLDGTISTGVIYKDYCPMAFNEGAYWLSTDQEIKNPFYGDKMLTCGSVKSEIK
tara:strand:+ start:45 stop:596 length:552 start_codon:yes stop_codon:yes gene_type:complete